MIELFVEGKQVDINVGFSTLLTMAIDDIKDFGAKNTTFSKTIILPGTKKNNLLFGNIFNVSASMDYDPTSKNIGYNFNAAIGANAYIFSDNMQVLKGTLRILEIIITDGFTEYEVQVVGELGGFIAKIGNKKLENLDFSAYNSAYSLANIVSSWDNASGGSGYFYPLIDYGTYSSDKHDWSYRTFRPALFVKEYIEKICSSAGYAIDFPLMATSRFKSLIVPHSQKVLNKKSGEIFDVSAIGHSGNIPEGIGYNVPFSILTTLGDFISVAGYSDSVFQYTATATYTGTFRLDMVVNWSSNGVPPFTIDLQIDTISGTTILGQVIVGGGGYDSGVETVSFIANNVSVVTGAVISVLIAVPPSSIGDSLDVTIVSGHLTFGSPAISIVPLNLGESVIMNDVIPQNILQKDFFSSIVKLFNLYIFEDYDKDRTLKIVPFIDFYLDAGSVDWSNKIDRSKPIKIKPMSELNSRYFEFNFKDDSDYYNDTYKKRYNEGYGTFKYDSEFEFAKEVQKVEVILSGTPLVGYAGEDKVYSTILKKNGNILEETVDSNIRILQAKKIAGVASWHIMNDGAIGTYTDYGYAGHLNDPDAPTNDIQFGVPKELFFTLITGALNVNQFNVYWSSYLAEITDKDSRLVTCTARLKKKDIYRIDFSKLIYLDGNLFRLNLINDFNATNEDTCKIELLKVINRIY